MGTELPLLVVISGPSGVGKDAVMQRLLALDPRLYRSLTMTTRQPRPGEVDGQHYDFVSAEDFERHVQAGDLLEHALVHGNRYGSPRKHAHELLESGHDVLLQVDVQGSLALREAAPGALFIYIAPEDPTALEARIRDRGADDATVAARNHDRARELAAQSQFEHVVVNREGALESTVEAVLEIIERERGRAGRKMVEV